MDLKATQLELQNILDRIIGKNTIFKNVLAAVVTGDGTFDWTGTASHANSEEKIAITANTPFYIASITKMFTATVIMRLYEQNKLDLDEPMSKYLPDSLIDGIHVYQGINYTRQVQIRHLLSHTSGIADYYQEKPIGGKSFFELLLAGEASERTPQDTITRARDILSANFIPGKKASYSDTNFQLLGFIIESITGKPLYKSYQELIFKPLDMSNTYLQGSEPSNTQTNEVVHIYYKDIDLTYNDALKTQWADGGLISTPADCLRFLKGLNRGDILQKSDTLGLMYNWRKLEFPIYYGFGTMRMKLPWIFSPFNPIPEMIGHFGSTGTCLLFCEELDVYLVCALNQVESRKELVQLVIGIMKSIKKIRKSA
jgi:CubicO group peptidase (beta-lactamase class C family)